MISPPKKKKKMRAPLKDYCLRWFTPLGYLYCKSVALPIDHTWQGSMGISTLEETVFSLGTLGSFYSLKAYKTK